MRFAEILATETDIIGNTMQSNNNNIFVNEKCKVSVIWKSGTTARTTKCNFHFYGDTIPINKSVREGEREREKMRNTNLKTNDKS